MAERIDEFKTIAGDFVDTFKSLQGGPAALADLPITSVADCAAKLC